MKHLSNRPLRLAAAAAMVISLLAACDQSKSPSNTTPASVAQDGKITLLKDISGVWTPTATSGLTTIYYADNRLQILQGDTPLAVALGDVDPAEATVNVNTVARGKEEILTIRKQWNTDHTAYNLSMTGSDGYQETLGFVRRVSNDDMNRISRLTVAKTPAPQPLQPVETSPASIVPSDRGVIDMWLGGIDMNMRSCPGSTCAAVIIVPIVP